MRVCERVSRDADLLESIENIATVFRAADPASQIGENQ